MKSGWVDAGEAAGSSASIITKALSSISAGWASLGIVGKAGLVIAAIAAIVAVVDALHVSAAEATENMDKAFEEYDTAKNKVQSVNSELQSANDRITELQAKGGLTFVEEAELEKLRESTELLRIQQDIAEKEAAQSAIEAADATVRAFNKNYKNDISRDAVDNYESSENHNIGLISDPKDISKMLAGIRRLKQLRDEARSGDDNWEYLDWEYLNEQISDASKSVMEQMSTLAEYKKNLELLPEELLTKEQHDLLDYIDSSIELIYQELDPAKWNQMKLDGIFDDKELSGMKDELVSMASGMKTVGISVDDVESKFPRLAAAIKDAGIEMKDFVSYINSNAGVIDIDGAASAIRNKFIGSDRFQNLSWRLAEGELNSFNEWLKSLSPDDLAIAYQMSLDTSSAMWSLDEWQNKLSASKEATQEELRDIKTASEETLATLSGITEIQKILSSQGAGKSISQEDFSTEDIQDYASAIEYVNGVYQLNIEKVNELVEAKAAEQISVNEANKEYAQMKYIENAKQIDKLRKSLADAEKGFDGNVDAIKDSIKALREENASLVDECNQYDMLSTSLRNAASAYQHWVNSKNSSDYGDLFDSTMLAVDEINNTFTTGNFGSLHYKAALDLVVPEDVDQEDVEQVKEYVDKLSRYLTSESGKVTGLNIGNFLQDAKDAGLMGYDESSDYWSINPGIKLEDFSRELKLAEGMVNAFFDELSLKGGEFSFSDEVVQSFGDLAIKAYEAKNTLQDAFGEQYEIKIDASDAGSTDDQIKALEATISEMDSLKGELNVDASQVENANDIIQYCVRQIQLLKEPAIMKVDTSAVQGPLGEAIGLLQQFQELNDVKEAVLRVDVNADTSNIDQQIADIAQQIQTNEVIKADLQINTTSVDSIKSSIGDIDVPALVRLLPDPSAIEGYNPDTKQVDVIYNPNDDALPESFDDVKRTVNYIPNTSRLPSSFSTITRYVNYVRTGDSEESGELNGTAHAYGTARASGDWGTAKGGKTLVGELGQELVVDVRTGKWYTVGDNGAEFVNIPEGAIVFNHKQTDSLFENGYAIGRARALATGTAMVSGGISGGFVNYQSSPSPGYRNPSSGASSSVENSYDKELETFDWIEVAIDRIERVIERFSKTASSAFKSLATRVNATGDEISMITQEISLQRRAYDKYMSAAEAVSLSYDLKQLVRNGAIDISQYDQDTQKLINDYKDLYEKALDCSSAIDDLHENLAQLYKDNFDNVQSDFENKLSLMEKRASVYNTKIDKLEEQGYLKNATYYKQLQKTQESSIGVLNQELMSLQNALTQAIGSGEIEEGSEAWYEMQFAIEDTKAAIEEAELAVIKYDNAIREIGWEYFDYAQERIGQITSEADFLLNLLDGKDMYDTNGNLSDAGIAANGVHAEKYGIYMAQADKYAEEIKRINKELANDPSNTKLIERRDELVESQRDAILAAKSEKEAMVDLVREGINIELEAIKKLIDAYTESLDSAKDLYDYQKKIADKTDQITDLEKQLAAYQNDLSEETRSKIQKIQVQLTNAKEDLKETEYERLVSDSKKMLDDLYSEYESVLNSRFDDIDATFEKLIALTNENFISINEYLSQIANGVGYTISDATNSVWGNGGGVNGFVSVYGEDITSKLTATGIAVENIFGVLEAIAKQNGVPFTGKSYASGGLIDYTGVANVHGSYDKPEMVLNAEDTRNFIKLRDILRDVGMSSQINSPSVGLPGIGAVGTGNGVTVGEINVTIPIEKVEDYNDFVNQLRSDGQFEKLVQEITIGRLAGKSKLSKNKFNW